MPAKWLWGGTSTFTEKLRSKYCSCAQQWTYNGLTDGTGRTGQPKLGHQPITPGWFFLRLHLPAIFRMMWPGTRLRPI